MLTVRYFLRGEKEVALKDFLSKDTRTKDEEEERTSDRINISIDD